MSTNITKPSFYTYLHEQGSLDGYVHDQIKVRLIDKRTALFDDRNVLNYRHGKRWALSASEAGTSEVQAMAAEFEIHASDIINHEIFVIEEHIESMAEQLYGSMMTHLYQTASEAAESVGNVVKRSEHGGDTPAGFLAILKKIQFGVDRYGRAQRPSLHVSPSTGKELIDALQNQPIEYHREVEIVSEQKEKEAVSTEADRISRFRWNSK